MRAKQTPAERRIVVVYGGSGFFGRLIVADLLENTDAQIVIASRRAATDKVVRQRVTFVRSDFSDLASVRATLTGASVVIHCAGPFQFQTPTLVRAAISSSVHYLDLAEDAEFVRQTRAFDEEARDAGVALLSGMSVVPGLAALLSRTLNFERHDSIRTFVAPGTRGSRGAATIRSLLSGAGRPLRVLRDGREIMTRGWSEPEWMEFPPPIGWRLQYLAIETADRDVLSCELAARSAEFKAGSEFAWLNRSLAVVAQLRACTGHPSMEHWADPMRKCLKLLGHFGTSAGGVLVEVTGLQKTVNVKQQIAVVTEHNGERIPALPAAIATAALLRGELIDRGATPLSSCLTTERLFNEFTKRGLRFWTKPERHASWQPLVEIDKLQS